MPSLANESTEQATLRQDWHSFTALTFLFGFGFAVYQGVFQNFFREAFHAREVDLGTLESLREIPGLLTALLAGTLVALAESRIAALGLIIGGIGIGMSGFAINKPSLIAITVFWSVGFHLYAAMGSAITLALAKGKEGGRHLGRMSAVGSSATVLGLGLAWLLTTLIPQSPYIPNFLVAGVTIVISGVLCFRLSTHAEGGKRQPIVFRREYGLFYLLTFLEGCRRQIFSIFASFALILVYHVDVRAMLILQFVNAILISLSAPYVGKIVDRVEKRDRSRFTRLG